MLQSQKGERYCLQRIYQAARKEATIAQSAARNADTSKKITANSNPLDDLNERQRKIYNELPITFSTAEGLEIAMEYNIPEPSTAPINVAPQSPMALIHTLFIVYYSVYLKDHYPTIYLPNGSLPIIQEMPKQQTYVVMAVAGMVSHSGSIGL